VSEAGVAGDCLLFQPGRDSLFVYPVVSFKRVSDRDQVLQWSLSVDIDALGALSSLLFDPSESRQISPNLTLEDYLQMELPYLERCFREDPEIAERFGDWRDDPVLRSAYDEAKLWKEGLDELGMEPVDYRWKP
jgi:hypothetical protein